MAPPSFGDQEYWQDRFSNNRDAFDWLLPATTDSVLATIRNALDYSGVQRPRILHVGCGTSELSLQLRSLVLDPGQVHNTDYSSAAIEIGSGWEGDVLASENCHDGGPSESSTVECGVQEVRKRRMRWSVLDVLSSRAVRSLLSEKNAAYSVIVDKSTSDAISCGDYVDVDLPYTFKSSDFIFNSGAYRRASIHPLHVLAIHLAALTVAGGQWLAWSYASHRFPFLSPFPSSNVEGLLQKDVVSSGLPHPSQLWRLDRKEEVEAPQSEELDAEQIAQGNLVHKPKISYWLYVLVRTETALTWQ